MIICGATKGWSFIPCCFGYQYQGNTSQYTYNMPADVAEQPTYMH
jgi:hypothetical protein